MCINDLREIVQEETTYIRVWDDNRPKNLLNPVTLFMGRIADLPVADKVATADIVTMLPISNVLVFFIDYNKGDIK